MISELSDTQVFALRTLSHDGLIYSNRKRHKPGDRLKFWSVGKAPVVPIPLELNIHIKPAGKLYCFVVRTKHVFLK